MKIIVTGGAGFIGSAFIRHTLASHRDVRILNVDKLSYAGNLDNLKAVEADPRYRFVRADICDKEAVSREFTRFTPDGVVHFAAESHVDRSILSPAASVDTNVHGTFVLLEAARAARLHRFVHVSTDEVYGSLTPPAEADEEFPLQPSSPYSASKAASDLLALSYFRTFDLPVVVTRASNNYGPYQFPEKLIPLMICNALEGRPLPIYGDGLQVRDWLHVDDHCRAIWDILRTGVPGQVYNIGGAATLTNLDLVRRIMAIVGADESLIWYVNDRPGHDRRYALSSEKIQREIGWKPTRAFDEGLQETVEWFDRNQEWVQRARSGAYREYYAANYAHRMNASEPILSTREGPR